MSFFQKSVNSFLNNKISDKVSGLDPNVQSIFWNLMGKAGFNDKGTGTSLEAVERRIEKAEALAAATNASGKIQIKSDGGDNGDLQNYDWRARLRPKNGGMNTVYGLDNDPNGLLAPLKATGGPVWQVTPQIFLSGVANYQQQQLHGSNYPIYSYLNSTPPALPVQADFYANDMFDGHYLLAMMHFLKVTTKSYFGEQSLTKGTMGTPPPVLLFEYLGDHGFNEVPVHISDYSIQLPEDCDYVPVETNVGGNGEGTYAGKETTYVPTRMNVMVNLIPNYAPKKTRKEFDLDNLRNGSGYKGGFV